MRIEAQELLKKVTLFCIIIISMYFIVTVFNYESPSIEGYPLIVSNVTFDSISPEFSVSKNHIYASWISTVNSHNSDVMFRKIDNDSKSFSNIMNISSTSGTSNIIKLRNSENNVYITWEDKQSGKWELLFRKSPDSGEKFGNTIHLSETTGNVHLHDLLANGNSVFVTWAANENTSSINKDVYFRKSLDRGDSFNEAINLSNSNEDSLDPHMAINYNGSVIYVVWTECDTKHDEPICSIVFTKSSDQGNTFTIPKKVSYTTFPYTRVMSHGTFDTTISNLNSSVDTSYLLNNASVLERINSINPFVFTTSEGKNVYILWEQEKFGTGSSDIVLTISNDYGESFNPALNVSNSSGISRLAHGQLVGQNLYIVWSDTLDHNKNFDVMLRKINVNNKAGKVINLSNNTGNSVSPFVFVNNNQIFVVWVDDTNTASVTLWSGDTSGSSGVGRTLNDVNAGIYTDPLIFEADNKMWISWTEYNNVNHRIVLIDLKKYNSLNFP
jgi:hypothetical protein